VPEIPESPLWAWLLSAAIVLPGLGLFLWVAGQSHPNHIARTPRGIALIGAGAALIIAALASALQGAFASEERLKSMSSWIGVKTPAAARLVCWGFICLVAALGVIAGVILVNVG
jgi:hypothetical protein